MKYDLTLVKLKSEQIEEAKKVNGQRKKITHALICGPYGQIFGTEKQCRKYFSAWINVFPLLFTRKVETNTFQIENYETTFDLVNKLIEKHDPLERANNPALQEIQQTKQKKRSFFARIFG